MVDADLFAAIALILVAAKVCGDLFERVRLPSVLGELLAGIAIGNLRHLGLHGLDFVPSDPNLALLGQIGVVLLMFQIGLESDVGAMVKVGAAALLVACVGVIAPMALGTAFHAILVPDAPWQVHLFIGAVLAATSVGITARVLKDLGRIDSPTGRVVLGAAVIDDVIGLIVLAVVGGLITSAAHHSSLDLAAIALLIAKAIGFLGLALALGPVVSKRLYGAANHLRSRHVLLAATLSFCFAVAWLADLVSLAPIIGAFAAGLVLDEVTYAEVGSREQRPLEDQLRPLGEFLTPMFFVLTGAKVDLAALGDPHALSLAGALLAAAVIGKQACGLVVFGRGVDRLSIGIGMTPRGEVDLIFAATGHAMILDGRPVIDDTAFAAIVIMVMTTTMLTPPLLAWSLRRAPVSVEAT